MYARIEKNIAIEVISFDPKGKFHPSIKWLQVPSTVKQGWVLRGGEWSPPVTPEPVDVVEPEAEPKTLTVIEFKMCFTSPERIGIYTLKDAGNPILSDWLSIIDDPRCTGVNLGLQSTKDAVAYLTTVLDDFTADRAAMVLAGVQI